MLLDKQNMFCEAQDLSQDAGSYLSTNTIDLGAAGTMGMGGTAANDAGKGQEVEVFVQIIEAFTSGGAATLQVQLVQADNAALSTNLEVLKETPVLALATLTAGTQFKLGSLPEGITKRYLGLRFVIGTATTTAGTVTAGLALSRQSA